jgi:hypothetical protein
MQSIQRGHISERQGYDKLLLQCIATALHYVKKRNKPLEVGIT